ncbi:MAG: type III pantothenate kinase [Pirellulaceae bacterium]|nr:type III pantothenate kinase [Pirellulaceae bacterium]
MMRIATADIGNSSIKYLVGDISRIHERGENEWPESQNLTLESLSQKTPLIGQPMDWFVSSVNEENAAGLRERLQAAGDLTRWHCLDRQDVSLTLDVDQPERVGMDRVLAAFAAHRIFGLQQDVIVVDCGTALTIDLVGQDGVFRGGVIMTGPATNLSALNLMTEALPDLSTEKLVRPASVLGRSTREAMLSGAWYNGLGAIREVVQEMQNLSQGEPRIVGTGGGLGPWRDVLPQDWVLVDDLVLRGIFLAAADLQRKPNHGAF